MYKMKVLSMTKIILALIGAGMLFGSVYFSIKTYDFLENSILVNGKVIDMVKSKSSFAPVFSFKTLKNNLYELKSRTYSDPPAYYIGENVEVLYLSSDPHTAKINGLFSLWGVEIILGIIGAVFVLIPTGMILFEIFQDRKKLKLINQGKRVKSTYEGVELNESLSVNGRHPYRIVSKWLDSESNQLHVFRSENLWFNPTDYIHESEITVYIDKLKPESYFVDISFLPKIIA